MRCAEEIKRSAVWTARKKTKPCNEVKRLGAQSDAQGRSDLRGDEACLDRRLS